MLKNFTNPESEFFQKRFVARERPESDWGDSSALDDFRKRVQSRQESGQVFPEVQPEISDIPKSIDPGLPQRDRQGNYKTDLKERFPNLRPIIEELEKITSEAFRGIDLKEDKFRQLNDQILLTKEAMLYQAIAENWSKQTLVDLYRAEMDSLRARTDKKTGIFKRAWIWITKPSPQPLEGENEHIQDRDIMKINEIKRYAELIKVETKYRKRVLETTNCDGEPNSCYWEHNDTYFDDKRDEDNIDEDQSDYVKEEAIPFYRSYVVNKAIVHNEPMSEALKEYTLILINLYKSCKK